MASELPAATEHGGNSVVLKYIFQWVLDQEDLHRSGDLHDVNASGSKKRLTANSYVII